MSFAVLQSAFGLVAFVLIAWLLSENRRGVRLRLVVIGLALQFALAVVLLKLPMFQDVFLALNRAAQALEEGTRAGTSFVFGYLGAGRCLSRSRIQAQPMSSPFADCPSLWSRRRCRRCSITGR